jgi:hypothetical protein
MENWQRDELETLYKGVRRTRMDLFCLCVTLRYKILDLTDLACGSWDTQHGEEWYLSLAR